MTGRVLRIGTRASRLALAQVDLVAAFLRAADPGLRIEVVEITTAGDRDQSTPLREGTGWFTSAIQEALLDGRADVAVHSYKDLPTARPAGLVIGAVPVREDVRDAVVTRDGRGLAGLAVGAVIGTSSPRREAQLRALRPDLQFRLIRGNVETRIGRVDGGDYDATVLALAGLRRLGIEHRAGQILGPDEMLPAPAQGAIAVECREADATTVAALAAIDVPRLRAETGAERAFMAALEAGCSFPAAALATVGADGTLELRGLVELDGKLVSGRLTGAAGDGAGLGERLAARLLGRGG
ncbi:MAG: hydroxymethylbilane synthase [Chloroflexi bacterium]|nr:hydroxymethylbilane synthase [Chloroflexota bacterium]